jgi:hypothetical protein
MTSFVRSFLIGAVIAGNAGAQKVLLELRPKAGDTLRMELQQTTEMSGAAVGAPSAPVTTKLKMFSRAIVESAAPIASLILAITDSAEITSSDVYARALTAESERELEGRQMRLRLWPDGTVTLNDGAESVPREVSDLIAVMPASFPSKAVSVGESWMREMPVPTGDLLGIPEGSVVRSKFRLDSVSAEGELAFVSMSGTLVAAATKPMLEGVSGTVTGTLVVNRKRGWLSESSFQLTLKSVAQSNGKADPARKFSVKVTQSMRVLRPAVAKR